MQTLLKNVNPPMLITLKLEIQPMLHYFAFRELQQEVQPKPYCCDFNPKIVDLEMEKALASLTE